MSQASILIVEDDAIIARSISVILKNRGYDVVNYVASGEEALQQAECCQPNLVLMDIKLAGELDGIQTAQQMRNKIETVIIYLTAHADPETMNRAQSTQPLYFIVKPFGVTQLCEAVEMALKERQSSADQDEYPG